MKTISLWPLTFLLATAFVVMGGLVWHGNIPGSWVMGAMGAVGLWFVRSPLASPLEKELLRMLTTSIVVPQIPGAVVNKADAGSAEGGASASSSKVESPPIS